MLTEDDGRSALLCDLGPGQETNLPLRVKAPSQPGRYILELDLVQEHVAWFKAFGSATTQFSVKVT